MKYIILVLVSIINIQAHCQERLTDFKNENNSSKRILATYLDTTYIINIDLKNDFDVFRLEADQHTLLHNNTLDESFISFGYFAYKSTIIFYGYNKVWIYDFTTNKFLFETEFEDYYYMILHHKKDEEFIFQLNKIDQEIIEYYEFSLLDFSLKKLFETQTSHGLTIQDNYISVLEYNGIHSFTIYNFDKDSVYSLFINQSYAIHIDSALYYIDYDIQNMQNQIKKYNLESHEITAISLAIDLDNGVNQLVNLNNNLAIVYNDFFSFNTNILFYDSNLNLIKTREFQGFGYLDGDSYIVHGEHEIVQFDLQLNIYDTILDTLRTFDTPFGSKIKVTQSGTVIITSNGQISLLTLDNFIEKVIFKNESLSTFHQFVENRNGSYYYGNTYNSKVNAFFFLDNEDSLFTLDFIDNTDEGFNRASFIVFQSQLLVLFDRNLYNVEDKQLVKINDKTPININQTINTTYGALIFAEKDGLWINVYEYINGNKILLTKIHSISNISKVSRFGDAIIMQSVEGTYLQNRSSNQITFYDFTANSLIEHDNKLYTLYDTTIYVIEKDATIKKIPFISNKITELFSYKENLYIKDDFIYKLENNSFVRFLPIPTALQEGRYWSAELFKNYITLKTRTVNDEYYLYSFDGQKVEPVVEKASFLPRVFENFIINPDYDLSSFVLIDLEGNNSILQLNTPNESIIDVTVNSGDTLILTRGNSNINNLYIYKTTNKFSDILLLKEVKRDLNPFRTENFIKHNNSLYCAGGKSLFLLNDLNNIQKIEGVNLSTENKSLYKDTNYLYYFGVDATTGDQVYRYNLATTKTNEIVDNKLIVYPNPASSYINIKNLNQTYRYTITNNTGEVVQSGIYDQNTKNIDIDYLQNGFYILNIKDGENYFNTTFVKMSD